MYVMKFCLMRKEKALGRSVPANTHVYVVKFDILCFFKDIAHRSIDGYDVHVRRYILMFRHIRMYIMTVDKMR